MILYLDCSKTDKSRGYTGMWGFSTDKVCNLLYHGKYAVKYKGREVKRREEAWQPNGRVEQEYDKFFDKVNWKDLIKKQIKEGLPEDAEKDAENDAQKLHDKFVKRIDEIYAAKEKEIMTV